MRYGDDRLWESLSDVDRPFFQRAETRHQATDHVIDWRREQEWRHIGDVDLSKLPRDAALVFVPTDDEARQLAPLCHWPITLLEGT